MPPDVGARDSLLVSSSYGFGAAGTCEYTINERKIAAYRVLKVRMTPGTPQNICCVGWFWSRTRVPSWDDWVDGGPWGSCQANSAASVLAVELEFMLDMLSSEVMLWSEDAGEGAREGAATTGASGQTSP
jgi:hypothetical protein